MAIGPAYVGTGWGYRDLLRTQGGRVVVLAPAAVLGSVLGCLLLLVTSEEPVDWASVAVLAPSALLGGYAGAHVAQRLSPGLLHAAVVVLGVGVGIALL